MLFVPPAVTPDEDGRRGWALPGLRAARMRAALTQDELAAAAGLGPRSVSELERGRRRAYPTTVRKLAAALGVAPAELYRTPEEA